ncbi:MAG: hypothetical protein LH480_08700 [Rubrivivax sp.]|nr:hypothetical protein [Rubrivivax sp.]
MPFAHARRTWMPLLLLCAWVLAGQLLLAAAPARAQLLADPRQPWSSADSAHFRVHYRSVQRTQAEAVARAAEAAWPRVTQALQWQPRGRTEIVVYNEVDQANGFTTPLPFNLIGVFLAPPDEGELLTNQVWLDLLLVHEFAHVVHLDKVRGVPRVLQTIFGNVPWFIPNLFQPNWMLEGLAVLYESDPARGHGRLQGPWFEAWLRAERSRGFLSLAELNSDGRTLPVNKQYLYGAYFMEFLSRRYGADKPTALVEQYSGNIVPRLHSVPWAATGRTMDTLWDEFLADLTQQVDTRAAPIRSTPESVGTTLAGPLFNIGSVAALPATAAAGGGWLAVVEDGLSGTQLMRVAADGTRTPVARVNRGARIDVSADGRVLIAQPDICDKHYYAYDLHRLEGNTLKPLTRCAHMRRAVDAGDTLLALQLQAGRTRLVALDGNGAVQRELLAPQDDTDLIDLAAAPDGRTVAVITRRGSDWRVLQIDVLQPAAAPRVMEPAPALGVLQPAAALPLVEPVAALRELVRRSQPIQALRHGAAGLEMVIAEGGVPNVWRLQGAQLQRLTHSHTAVLTHAGSSADGALASVVIAPGGVLLQRLAQPVVLQTVPAVLATQPAVDGAAPGAPALRDDAATPVLGQARDYSALRSVYPRSWFPAAVADRGLTAFGASTSGGDALGWHRYAALAMWETSQREPIGSLEYLFVGNHGLSLARELNARAWTTSGGEDTTTVYDRNTRLQWLSRLPILRVERRIVLGLGAAADWTDRVDLRNATTPATTTRRRDERLVAALIDIDTSNDDWYSEGRNRGWHAGLLIESYEPLAGNDALRYDGTVLRGDVRGYLPLGRSVLALRYTEARARGRTEPFQLGGAIDEVLQFGPVLNERNLALRGYRGDEAALRGANARVASLEWRTPLLDIDRHAMVPALGINRLSATMFVEAGRAFGAGSVAGAGWQRAVGVELLGETKLFYALGLQLRVGMARALDGRKDTRGYLTLGRAF